MHHTTMTAIGSAACAVGLFASADAAAQSSFNFVVGLSINQISPDFMVAPGGTITLDVFLRETFDPMAGSELDLGGGLTSAEFTVSRVDIPTLIEPATIVGAAANEAEFNDAFGPTIDLDPSGESVSVIEFLDLSAPLGPIGVEVAPGERLVLLGSVTLQAGLVEGEISSFEVDQDDLLDFFVLVNPAVDALDLRIGQGGFRLIAIPGPASLAALGLGLVVFRRRGR